MRAAVREQARTIYASTALESWSLGVLAVELFTGRPALVAFHSGHDHVWPHAYCDLLLCVCCNRRGGPCLCGVIRSLLD